MSASATPHTPLLKALTKYVYPYPLVFTQQLFAHQSLSLKRFAPFIDFLVARLGTQASPSQAESKYQFQRAYALSRDLKDQILDYSNTQLHQLQSNSVLVYVNNPSPPSVF
jgi:hypothetical protein